ncbi:DUF4376 domain-containing protein [Moraxella nasibovis]|uniref:DUF4376 domain-containing protein n=1 Tax=Moraxella nasibovis TaxID=2904120 RepID=UPI00240FF2C8|nr:DUF4376 domain-containing protein [Moraxella nasibovis]WFF39608.1 DUF4376 domain-containing protein [Moraxella nasibovis]
MTYPATKSVVQLDKDGLYIGQTIADLSPLESDEGVYLLPTNAIDVAPPELTDSQSAKWTGSDWQYLPDYRGQTAYRTTDGTSVIIDQVGALADDLTLLKPMPHGTWNGTAWVVTAEKQAELKTQAQAQTWEQIKAHRYTVTRGGVYLKSVDKWFHTDDSSRTQYLALQILPEPPKDLLWKTMDNEFVPMTKTLLTEIAMTMLIEEQADFANAERHRLAMMQADDPLAYDYSTGWSRTHG